VEDFKISIFFDFPRLYPNQDEVEDECQKKKTRSSMQDVGGRSKFLFLADYEESTLALG
jgi:hypothetical protein